MSSCGAGPSHGSVRKEEQRVRGDLVHAQLHQFTSGLLDLPVGLSRQGEHHVHIHALEPVRQRPSHGLLDLARGVRPAQVFRCRSTSASTPMLRCCTPIDLIAAQIVGAQVVGMAFHVDVALQIERLDARAR